MFKESYLELHLEDLPSNVARVWSNDSTQQLRATSQICLMLTITEFPPIDEVIQTGVVPRLVEFLTRKDSPQLRFKAACVLKSICSGSCEHTKVVIDSGAVPMLVKLLSTCRIHNIRKQAILALGNIACGSPEHRDIVLEHGGLDLLLVEMNENVRDATWALGHMCRGDPPPLFEQTKPALEVAAQLIQSSSDEEVVSNVCWIIAYFANGTTEQLQAVVDSAGVCSRLVELFFHPSVDTILPALWAVGNILADDDKYIQYFIDLDVLPALYHLLTGFCERNEIKVDRVCWAISIILLGSSQNIQAVIEADVIGPLIEFSQNDESDTRAWAVYVISSAIWYCTDVQLKYLVKQGCIKPLCDLLVDTQPKTVMNCLKGLEKILKADVNIYAKMIDLHRGFEKIDSLQTHDEDEIRSKAVDILVSASSLIELGWVLV